MKGFIECLTHRNCSKNGKYVIAIIPFYLLLDMTMGTSCSQTYGMGALYLVCEGISTAGIKDFKTCNSL